MVKMWSSKYLIIVNLYFCTCYGQELLDSSELLNVDDYFDNSTNSYFNNTGDINRIYEGKPIAIKRVPYAAAILNRTNHFTCGGSIISSEWILTAAHCITRGSFFKIRLGSRYYKKGGTVRNVRYAVVNSGYNKKVNNYNHDIALIRLKTPLKWSPKVRPIRLAKPNFKIPQKFLLCGWGVTGKNKPNPSNILRGLILSKVSNCNQIYKDKIPISRLQICASAPGKGACFGDSGGPLTNNGIQYGIVSGGLECASLTYPEIYTNVQEQYSWIRNVIKLFGGPMPIGFK